MVKLPIKIYVNGGESRSNVTNFKIKAITRFDSNVETVLEVLTQLNEKVIKPKAIDDSNEEWKVTLQLLKIVCSKTAVATLQETCLLYTSPSPRDRSLSRMPSSA